MSKGKYLSIGPGGKSCPCCFPGSRKGRKAFHKQAKRRQSKDDFFHQDLNIEDSTLFTNNVN